ncbi:MAG: YihY family inner membrane protein, partial [Myxococcaceae bacterium]|nr:YihY family inner membrane protein [Myxococcaceae bacterium]
MPILEPTKRRIDRLLGRIAHLLEPSRSGRFVLDIARALVAVARGFRGEKISLRASALTYISIFSLVPTLAVALALVEALGRHQFHEALRAFVFDLLAPGIREESARFLDRFLNTASSATAGSLGFIALAIAAGTLLRNLDSSINEIWNVRKARPIPLRIGIYAAILVLGPVALAVSLAGMGVLRSIVTRYLPFSDEVLTLAGALVSIAGFTFTYQVTPAVEVRFRSALAGGLVAGAGWDIAKHLYGEIAQRTFQASPAWGSLGAVPLFLTWIYVSWLLLLFGARLSYAVQYAWLGRGLPDRDAWTRGEALFAARIASAVARAHQTSGRPPFTLRALADELGVARSVIEPIVEQLLRNALIRLEPGGGLEPARPLDQLSLADVALAVGGADRSNPPTPLEKRAMNGLEAALDRAEVEFLARLRRIRWSDLPRLEEARPPGALEAPSLIYTSDPADEALG